MCTRHHALIRQLVARIRELEVALESAEEALDDWQAIADRNARAARAASVRAAAAREEAERAEWDAWERQETLDYVDRRLRAGDVQAAEYAMKRGRSWW